MNRDTISLHSISELEHEVFLQSHERLSGLLVYFKYIQETILIAFHNSGGPVPVPNDFKNPKLFAFITMARSFSIAKAAMDLTVSGYPLEGIALSRILLEIAQCTQYLVRHSDLIEDFTSGKVKLDTILKKAKYETKQTGNDLFGRLWGLSSRYAHASLDLLSLPLEYDENSVKISLVLSDQERIDDAAYVIMTSLLTQYLIFRANFLNDLDPSGELNERDKIIFDPENIRKYAKFGPISDEDLSKLYAHLTAE